MAALDLVFRIQGERIPADHGYLLFSAVCGIVPPLHTEETLDVFPINGRLAGRREITLTPTSRLSFRVNPEHIPRLLPLAGKVLNLGGLRVRVGVPEVHALVPAARLYSRLVVIKGFLEPEPFLAAAQRQLDTLGIKGKPSLVPQPQIVAANADSATGSHSPFLRRTLRLRDKEIVGFAVRVEELTADESIRLQEQGLGGRRHFGCGLFVPERKNT